MKRRLFLTNSAKGAAAATATVAAASSLAAPAIAGTKRKFKMVTSWPKNFPGLGTSAERLAKTISAATGGEIDIKVYGAGELVPAFEAFDAVANGTADFYHGADYYWQGKSKAFNFFASVPFGLTATEMMSWMYHDGGQELYDELCAEFNIKAFMGGNSGVQMGGWFNKEINTLEDFKGLRMRIPGLGAEVIRGLGGTASNIPGPEVFSALQQGRIDATEWVGPWNDLAFGFHKIAKYYYYPGFQEPGPSLGVGINLDLWKTLSQPQQETIRLACAAENSVSLAEFNTRNASALDDMVNKHKVEVRPYSDEILTKIGEISGKVVAKAGDEDAFGRRVYQSFMAARKKSDAWYQISEEAYQRARKLPFDYG
jgi:TRAP-type mannitol/chloroaromatic compound transport system substrate-binding protein